jgi:hypothetical protein
LGADHEKYDFRACGIFHKRRRKIMVLIPLKVRAGIAALILAGGTLASAAASATIITFSGLAGPDGTPLTTYTEGGFTVTTAFGQFSQALSAGNPPPSVVAGPNRHRVTR